MQHDPIAEPVYVTRPVLPPLAEYTELLAEIWDRAILTNSGPFHQRLEAAIASRIGMGYASLWNNGTTALMGALSQLDLSGEVIVTPFTFPATVHAISMLGLTPVFADVHSETMTIAPDSVESRITSRTTAILGTHIYGTSCDTASLHAIAQRQGLRVIYDGAHSFGIHKPVFADTPGALGDVTMLSFHATKLFHSVEGGALLTHDAELDRKFRLGRNFGISAEDTVEGSGLNGKMSEVHAAMGLLVLDRLDSEIDKRAKVADIYIDRLRDVPGLAVVAGASGSRQYFVVRVNEAQFGLSRDEIHARLRARNIFSRKYFYPLCSEIDLYSSLPSAQDLPQAKSASQECLVLPFFGELSSGLVHTICDVILSQEEN